MKKEPLATKSVVVAAVTALIGVVVAFGLPLSTEQQAAILALTAVVAPIVLALFARKDVTPVADPKTDEGEPLVPIWGDHNE